MPAQSLLSTPLRILVVEHDAVDIHLCIRALEKLGYAIHADVASCRENFESRVCLNSYDIVLSDYRMPGWTGLDALSILRSQGSDAPFLLVTGALGDDIAVECIKQGVTDYVSKDRLSRLPIAVERALGERLLRRQRNDDEEMRRLTETGLQLLFANNPLPMYVYDLQTLRFLEVNDAAVAFYGFSHEDFSQMNFFDIRSSENGFSVPHTEMDTSQNVWSAGEWRHRRKNGEIVDVSIIRHLIQHNGRDAGLGVVQDVTERHLLEKQLRQAQKFEAIGQLAGGIAHDFNNVLGAIIGWAELGLEQSPDRVRLRDYFKKIGEQAARAAGLTRQLLAFARRQILAPQNIQINEIVTGNLSLLESILGKNIKLELRLWPQSAGVCADATQLEQVLINLCVNARDAMPRGGHLTIETTISYAPEDLQIPGIPPGCYVELIVTDTGTGIDAATREHIFEPFFTTKEPGKGTGLGLATVFGIVHQHEGYIKVDTEPGRGSAFHIALPCVAPEPRPAQPIAARTASAACTKEKPRGGTETILLVEDYGDVREIGRVALERNGYRVLLARDGLTAIEQFHQNSDIALVVMDLVIPRMGGYSAILQMRDTRSDLPVIFTTDYSADSSAIADAQNGRDLILQKPYEACVLLRHVRDLLDRSSLHEMLDTMSSDVLFRHSERV